jgi:hypothetical protein
MEEPELNFNELAKKIEEICTNLKKLTKTPGPTRCVAKLSNDFDLRIGRNQKFPMYETIEKIVGDMNKEIIEEKGELSKLFIFQDHGNIILVSGFKKKPTNKEIRNNIRFTLTSHADEITFIKRKNSMEVFPCCNATPLVNFGIRHPEVGIFGFDGIGDERKFKFIGSGKLYKREPAEEEIRKGKYKKTDKIFFLENVDLEDSKREIKEGDLIIQNYDLTSSKYNIDTIFHTKALDDRVGVLVHLYTMKELCKYNIKAKAIFVGDEEGIDKDIAWARLARPSFKKYCKEDDFIIICDGFDGGLLFEFEKEKEGEHLDKALIVPYRSEGKGAGDPGLFSFLRDYVIDISKSHGFEVTTTTDYVSRSLDPKIMDDFPLICSIDWSNGPVVTPTEDYFNRCHVDESISIKQVINLIGTTFWTVYLINKEIRDR